VKASHGLKLDRRTLLIGGGAGVGLVVAFALWPRHLKSDLELARGEQAFGAYIKIARDGRVTVAVPQVETGQGIWTGLPQIVADELGAAWETVGVEPAPLTGDYGNPLASQAGWLDGSGFLRSHELEASGAMRITAVSTSVRAFERPMRRAAAVARTMLVGAAADRWNVAPGACETADGFVINGARTFTFGELAEEAADQTPPHSPELKQSQRGRLIGRPLHRLDGPAKADGSFRFGGDVRLPGMLYASVRIAPPGGRLETYRHEMLKSARGIRHVSAKDDWMGVAADTWIAAERGIAAADPVFSGDRTARSFKPLFEEALRNEPTRTFRRGDYVGAARGTRPLAAEYFVEPNLHLGLEPLTATARFTEERLEIWAATQAPVLARSSAAEAAGISERHVTLYPMAVGAPSGRAMEADAIRYAIELARTLDSPVQVTVSQTGSQNHDRPASGALARMAAVPGEGGITAAWSMHVATVSGMGAATDRLLGNTRRRRVIRTAVEALPPYSIPNLLIEASSPDLPFAAGYMRGSPEREFAFFTEGFIDELAHAAGMEPLAFRMSLLGGNGRLARCLQAAARVANWDGGVPGSTMGIAGASAYGSHIGLVASASIGEDQQVKVHRLFAAIDCGRVVNSGLVEQQIEAGLIWALAQATIPSPEWVAGMPRARPIGRIGLPRIGDTPEIAIEIISSSEEPGGVSGLGTLPLAPAVANAIHSGSGKRMRSLPFAPMLAA
jgi:isoquinoline 1-oxidoreductase subunit beta